MVFAFAFFSTELVVSHSCSATLGTKNTSRSTVDSMWMFLCDFLFNCLSFSISITTVLHCWMWCWTGKEHWKTDPWSEPQQNMDAVPVWSHYSFHLQVSYGDFTQSTVKVITCENMLSGGNKGFHCSHEVTFQSILHEKGQTMQINRNHSS